MATACPACSGRLIASPSDSESDEAHRCIGCGQAYTPQLEPAERPLSRRTGQVSTAQQNLALHDLERPQDPETPDLADDAVRHDPKKVLDWWEKRRATPAYIELLEQLAALQRMSVYQGTELWDVPYLLDDQISDIRDTTGWFARFCENAGDGDHHSLSWRPYLSGNHKWDPLDTTWSAYQGRTKTSQELYKTLATAYPDLGVVAIELTAPPELWDTIRDQIQSHDRGKTYRKLAEAWVHKVWRLLGWPGEPIGVQIDTHCTGSTQPHRWRPHLHVLVPAIGRQENGSFHHLARPWTPGRPVPQSPLELTKDQLKTLRNTWRSMLETEYGIEIDRDVSFHWAYAHWDRPDQRDTPGRAKIMHWARYQTRAYLQDVNDNIVQVNEESVAIRRRRDGETFIEAVPLKQFLNGFLSRLFDMPNKWTQTAYTGRLSNRWKARTLEELGCTLLDQDEEAANCKHCGGEIHGHQGCTAADILEFYELCNPTKTIEQRRRERHWWDYPDEPPPESDPP